MLGDEIDRLLEELQEVEAQTNRTKRQDYANDDDVLWNFKIVSEVHRILGVNPGNSPAHAALSMVIHKLARMASLTPGGIVRAISNEPLFDTVLDMRVYTMIVLACLNEASKETTDSD